MRILICNDDGVHADGLKILARELRKIAEVTIVAPLEERSTTGHTLTLDHPLRLVEIEKDVWGCSGYPADCALMGVAHIMKDRKPDLVVSGINRGANLGQDIYYSGTVAAAREASFHGVPSISVSSVLDFLPKHTKVFHYETAATFIAQLVGHNVHKHISPLTVLNINVPNLPSSELKGVSVARTGFRRYSEEIQERVDFRDRSYFWIGGIYKGFNSDELSDCSVTDEGRISLTCLNLLGHGSDEIEKWAQFIGQLG
jgi:5'-nucleotidase